MARDRIPSSVITPPAFLMTCASPSLSPSIPYTLGLASMQATTAMRLPGGSGRPPLSNEAAYSSLFLNSSSVTLKSLSTGILRAGYAVFALRASASRYTGVSLSGFSSSMKRTNSSSEA